MGAPVAARGTKERSTFLSVKGRCRHRVLQPRLLTWVSQRLVQLDVVMEQLSHQVMQHHEEMVNGMQLVMELEHDLQVANVICKNGRRHLSSSMHEVLRDLVITSNAKKKQFYLDLLPVLTQLQHALDIQSSLDSLVEGRNYSQAFLSRVFAVVGSLFRTYCHTRDELWHRGTIFWEIWPIENSLRRHCVVHAHTTTHMLEGSHLSGFQGDAMEHMWKPTHFLSSSPCASFRSLNFWMLHNRLHT